MNKRNAHTRSTKSSSPPNAMKICLKIRRSSLIHWKIIINDHIDLIDINTTSENIGGNKDFRFSGTESIHDGIAFCGIPSSVENSDDMTVFSHSTSNFICCITSLQLTCILYGAIRQQK